MIVSAGRRRRHARVLARSRPASLAQGSSGGGPRRGSSSARSGAPAPRPAWSRPLRDAGRRTGHRPPTRPRGPHRRWQGPACSRRGDAETSARTNKHRRRRRGRRSPVGYPESGRDGLVHEVGVVSGEEEEQHSENRRPSPSGGNERSGAHGHRPCDGPHHVVEDAQCSDVWRELDASLDAQGSDVAREHADGLAGGLDGDRRQRDEDGTRHDRVGDLVSSRPGTLRYRSRGAVGAPGRPGRWRVSQTARAAHRIR